MVLGVLILLQTCIFQIYKIHYFMALRFSVNGKNKNLLKTITKYFYGNFKAFREKSLKFMHKKIPSLPHDCIVWFLLQ
ncbi:hypothetical protein BBI00_09165 [Chryseobacterium arthrosphaerae]|uniref:Uncharacterized protein n=1 Tax=Chryseobacterium arthrosphaerae TaxID=651561 RepID=A0A1B8ZSB5_9FLAO|nr:hypothetical protein BBI00_09165 [Chryseobacterium arthrosphaerae]